MINEVAHIEAKVAGKKILVSEASVRTDLMFNDEDGTNCFDNQVIWNTLRDIGYEGSLTLLSFSKPLFSPQWKYLVHTLLHCLSSKSSSWDQFGTNIASALVGLATNQKFNFSKLIFDGMLRNLKDSKPFLMYPRFIQLFLNKQLEGISKPQNFLPTVVLPSKVFTFMSKCSPKFSGKLTPLTPHMLEVANAVRAEHSLHTEELDIPTSSHHSDDSSTSEKAKSSSPVASERPTSPNDYTPTDKVQTSGGNEGNLNLYGLTREVLRLKKQNTKQAAQILRLKTKIKILVKQVKPLIAEYRSFVKINATLSKKKKLKKAHKKKSSSFKQGRKKVSDGSTGLNEVDVNSGDSQVNEGTAQVFEGTAEVIEGTEEVHEGTAQVHESTAKVNESTAEVHESTAEVNESTAGANLSTEPSMKEVEDEAGPSTFQDESDEFIQDDTLIADLLVNISKNRRGACSTSCASETMDADEVMSMKRWVRQCGKGFTTDVSFRFAAQTMSERVLEKPNEPLYPPEGHTAGNDEVEAETKELMAICIKLSKQVLDLEKENDAQAVEILKLKQRVESSDNEEDASKQGRESDKTKSMF
ncbi:hypothetical protein Tco_0641276 [Tanacetum coccineum]